MDEKIIEQLSRYLDRDLSSEEERKLEARLESDPLVRAQLESMKRVRQWVAALAASEKVPAELDAVVEPLLHGKVEPLYTRPWARWLATAAVAVIGFTVIIEVNRRNPGPDISAISRVAEETRSESEERFTLAPLPTSSVPPENQPLGASDRLLASPIPEVELEEPRALEVIGPLNEADGIEATIETAGDERTDQMAARSSVADKDDAKGRTDLPSPSEPTADRESAAPAGKKGEGQDGGRAIMAGQWDSDSPLGTARLFVFVDGESAWEEFRPSATCKPGRYPVRVVIAGGVVREARPVGGVASASPTQRLCAADLVINLEIERVADGEFPAEVVVEPRGPAR
jgi:hypothetical protein